MFSNIHLLEYFREELDQAHSIRALEGVLRKLAERAEVTHVIYVLPVVPGNLAASAISIMTYPHIWSSRYVERKYFLIDPVASVHLYSILPTDWSDLPRESKQVQTIFGEGAEFGIGPHGLTIPIRGRFNEIALFSVTSSESRSEWEAKMRFLTPQLNMAAYILHNHVLRLTMKNKHVLIPTLSPRERECIICLAAGMRDAEIADRLGISRRVVSAYIKSLRYKLDAPTRANAVARAFKIGIINLDDL